MAEAEVRSELCHGAQRRYYETIEFVDQGLRDILLFRRLEPAAYWSLRVSRPRAVVNHRTRA